ncbi:MAG: hypothetical protein DCC57_18940 [Chloroflexi bacterium]|nr:MAG: hypothetical protein DCC57_18940 [Chloroflexota bacterium]
MSPSLLILGLSLAGLFTMTLGVVHFFFPLLWDFAAAIPRQGAALRPMRLGPLRYATQRSDVYGITWVMNHAASYTLTGIGLVDLLAPRWLGQPYALPLALWIAGFWLIRAVGQLYLGRRAGDWWVLAGFALLGLLHIGAAFA